MQLRTILSCVHSFHGVRVYELFRGYVLAPLGILLCMCIVHTQVHSVPQYPQLGVVLWFQYRGH